MNEKTQSACRIYAIQAREARLAVVFRRGPSKQVLLLLWNTDTDEFIEGQWFKGRIHFESCDLSPSGERLIYFAATHKPPYFTWTAVSKPPCFTAIALWPKGDSWGGGGIFITDGEIKLDHLPNEIQLAEGFNVPQYVKVHASGFGENLYNVRMARDGWRLMRPKDNKFPESIKSPIWPPEIWCKSNPKSNGKYELGKLQTGEHMIFNQLTGESQSLGKTDWADWCHSGDLLYAKDGKIFRLAFERKKLRPIEDSKMLIDLRDKVFTEKAPPEVAKMWGGDK